MILGCHGDYIPFKIESYYFCIIELNLHNPNIFCIHAFSHKRATVIAARSEYV